MVARTWTDADTVRANEIWGEYQAHNEVALLTGKTAGIDPESGRVWLGESASEIVEQMEREGKSVPLYFVRVGSDHYLRKGAHR